jgi:hypothetical protein
MAKDTLEEALAPYDVQTALYKLAVDEWGSTEAQAYDLAALHHPEFRKDAGGQITHIDTSLPAGHPDVAALIAKQYPHLVPAVFEVPLADKAFLENNFGARGVLVRTMGEAGALALAKRYGHDSLHSREKGKRPEGVEAPTDDTAPKIGAAGDHKNNPFSKAGWSITKQGTLLRAVGREKCAQIAASVGSKIGATRPNADF